MTPRRVALWCLPLTVAVVLAIVVAVVMSKPSGAAMVAGRLPAPLTASAGPTTAPSAAAGTAQDGVAGGLTQGSTQDHAALTAALSAMAAQPGAPEFAVAIVDHRTGLSYTYDGDETFQTASVVKVEILAELLLQAQQEDRPLTAQEQGLADTMIRQSDNDAASALWSAIGDTKGLSAANTTLGLTETVPGTDGWWGLTTTTVSDQVKLLDTIADPDGPLGASNQVILNLMGSVEADQDWGVSAAAEAGESTALKNGWMTQQDQDGRWTVNSIGRITGPNTDVTLAVMTRGHATLDAGTAFVENIAKLTRTQLSW